MHEPPDARDTPVPPLNTARPSSPASSAGPRYAHATDGPPIIAAEPPGRLSLELLAGRYAVCRLDPSHPVPAWAWSGHLTSVTRTDAELSIICAESAVPGTVERAERGWQALRVTDPLDFDAVGIMARLTVPLARAGISILALATFDTDYLLVRAADLERALTALRADGHSISITARIPRTSPRP